MQTSCSPSEMKVRHLAGLVIPWGGQEIELQEITHVEGACALLRIRIREGRRFTVFDIDAVSADLWARRMLDWSSSHLEATGAIGAQSEQA